MEKQKLKKNFFSFAWLIFMKVYEGNILNKQSFWGLRKSRVNSSISPVDQWFPKYVPRISSISILLDMQLLRTYLVIQELTLCHQCREQGFDPWSGN